MRNKNGQMAVIGTVILGVLLVAGLIGGGVYLFANPAEESIVSQSALTSAGGCQVEPYITLTGRDAVNLGTAVTNFTMNHEVNGVTKGAFTSGSSGSKFGVGDNVRISVAKSDYLALVADTTVTKCGENSLVVDIYATDDSTFKVFNDVGNVVSDSSVGGTTNQSSSSTQIDMEVKITANSDQSSGDMVIVIDASNTTEIDEIILSGANKVALPEFFTVQGANSKAVAYEVPALVDGASKTYNLKITPESGQTIGTVGNAVLMTAYTKQWFVDTDGSFQYGVENSDGTAQYEDDFDYDWIII